MTSPRVCWLSAMMVPDLLGTLGTFLHYTTRPVSGAVEGGLRFPLERSSGGNVSLDTKLNKVAGSEIRSG